MGREETGDFLRKHLWPDLDSQFPHVNPGKSKFVQKPGRFGSVKDEEAEQHNSN